MRALAALAGVSLLAGCTYASPPPLISPPNVNFSAEELAPWRPVDAETGQINDLAGLQALAEAFPDSSSVRLRLLGHHARAENIPGVVKEALWLAERGYSFSAAGRAQILEMAGDTAIAARLADQFGRNKMAVESSTVAATVPADAKLVESIAFDPVTNAYFASSIVSRDLFRGQEGNWTPLEIIKGGSFAGLAVDKDRRILWTTSGAYDPTPRPSSAFSGIVGFDLDGNKVAYRLPGDGGATPSDIHLSERGRLFASDPLSGAVYSVRSPPGDLETLVGPGMLRSPQGLATRGNGGKLYVSDYRYGIAIVDIFKRKVYRLKAEKPMMLDGIDGLWRHGNRLIAVQNGTNPKRIISIELSPLGTSATNLTVLEQAHPDWTEPLGGSIHDGALYYVANGQWDRFGKGGALNPDKPPIPTMVRHLPLD